jgi:hypothetical protein
MYIVWSYDSSVRNFCHCHFTGLSWQGRAVRCCIGRCLREGWDNLYVRHLLTPWCRFLLEMLTGLQLVKKFPAFHGTRRFITALTSVHHLSLSWAIPIQSIYPHPTSWRSILILSTHQRLGLPSGLLPSGFPSNTLYAPLSSPICATWPSPSYLLLDFIIPDTLAVIQITFLKYPLHTILLPVVCCVCVWEYF